MVQISIVDYLEQPEYCDTGPCGQRWRCGLVCILACSRHRAGRRCSRAAAAAAPHGSIQQQTRGPPQLARGGKLQRELDAETAPRHRQGLSIYLLSTLIIYYLPSTLIIYTPHSANHDHCPAPMSPCSPCPLPAPRKGQKPGEVQTS